MNDDTERRKLYFQSVYENNLWNGRESRSGQGSDVASVDTLIENIPSILTKYNISSFLDVPCGDFNWMREIDFGSTVYIGGDIVPDIIENNINLYSSDMRNFKVIDIMLDPLPSVDMIFVRDCFIHFSTDFVMQSIVNISRSSIKYLCVTHDLDKGRYPDGKNIELGVMESGVHYYFRPLNFELPPFSFPPPIDYIPEPEIRNMAGGQFVMAIWDMNQVRAALERNTGA